MDLSLSPIAGREQKWKDEKDYVLNFLILWVYTELFWDLSNKKKKKNASSYIFQDKVGYAM